ncbi:MAG: hypothetical protein VCE43_15495 [Myxococcota bacterium]
MADAEQSSPGLGRRLLNGWMAIAGRFGYVQTLMLLVFTYAILIGPVGIGMFLGRADLLGKRGLKAAGSAWIKADSPKPDLERAKLLS